MDKKKERKSGKNQMREESAAFFEYPPKVRE